mmetsp:Transcript_24214/g.34168  ORF Transcript_24214/g.34168 Transcript_24214/m.34168 type:complete len:126 (-) Transcript_24214:134-511(-)
MISKVKFFPFWVGFGTRAKSCQAASLTRSLTSPTRTRFACYRPGSIKKPSTTTTINLSSKKQLQVSLDSCRHPQITTFTTPRAYKGEEGKKPKAEDRGQPEDQPEDSSDQVQPTYYCVLQCQTDT